MSDRTTIKANSLSNLNNEKKKLVKLAHVHSAHLGLSVIIIWDSLQWRHNLCYGVSNHQPHDCLLNRLFRHRSKQTSKLRVTGLCEGIHRWPVNSPNKGPVTRKTFQFDDVIMLIWFRLLVLGVHVFKKRTQICVSLFAILLLLLFRFPLSAICIFLQIHNIQIQI